MIRSVAGCLVILAAVFAAPPAMGASVASWSASTAEQFASGTLDGTAIDEEGRVSLAPGITNLWGPGQGVVWAIQPSGRDGAFVALSGPAQVLRVAAGGEAEVWYRSEEESLVTALANADADAVYFGLSPEGRVVHAARSGGEVRVETLIETGAKFVWGLAATPDGSLWVGTGVPGKLLRRAPSGAVETVFESGDDPVRSVAAHPDGGVVFGTGGRGRVAHARADGQVFVLHDADEAEIVSIAVGSDGTVFALAAQGAKQPGAARPGQSTASAADAGNSVHVVVTPRVNGEPREEATPEATAATRPAVTPAPGFQVQPGGALYRVDVDGGVRKIWQTVTEMPFAVVHTADGRLLVSTGDAGRLHALDGDGRSGTLLRIASNQASALAVDGTGRVLIGGTTDARVERLSATPRERGAYSTPAIDAGAVADWGRLRWHAELPDGATLRVSARSGNTDEPDRTWSAWVDRGRRADGSGVASEVPAARWFQARFELAAGRGGAPRLERVEIAYQPRNRSPEIRALTVEAPGIVWVQMPSQSSMFLGPLVADDPVSRGIVEGLNRVGRVGTPLRKAYEAGARTISWQADDPDNDRLLYSLHLRREGEDEWFPLAVDHEDGFFSWDAREMPDGVYRVRLQVDDAPDNPNGTHRIAERVGDAFRVDNTRPVVSRPEVRWSAGQVEIRFEARDADGTIAAVEYALDDGAWRPISPVDGVADSEVESYRLLLDRAGKHALRVRAVDGSGNVGGGWWIIEP